MRGENRRAKENMYESRIYSEGKEEDKIIAENAFKICKYVLCQLNLKSYMKWMTY